MVDGKEGLFVYGNVSHIYLKRNWEVQVSEVSEMEH